MKALILTLGLSLVAALLSPAWSEESTDLSGKWYLKAMVTDKDIPELNVESFTPMIVTPLDGDRKIKIDFTMLVQGQCHEITAIMRKNQELSEYVAKEINALVSFKPLPVKDQYVVYAKEVIQGQVVHLAKLLGRDKRIQESLEAFKKDVSANGYNPEKVNVPKQIDTCPADEQ